MQLFLYLYGIINKRIFRIEGAYMAKINEKENKIKEEDSSLYKRILNKYVFRGEQYGKE